MERIILKCLNCFIANVSCPYVAMKWVFKRKVLNFLMPTQVKFVKLVGQYNWCCKLELSFISWLTSLFNTEEYCTDTGIMWHLGGSIFWSFGIITKAQQLWLLFCLGIGWSYLASKSKYLLSWKIRHFVEQAEQRIKWLLIYQVVFYLLTNKVFKWLKVGPTLDNLVTHPLAALSLNNWL